MFVANVIETAPIVVVVPVVVSAIGVKVIPIVIAVPIVMSAMVSCELLCFAVW